MAQYELNLRDYLRILKKRKLVVIFSALSLGFFSFLFANLQKPIPLYRAASSVKVERNTNKARLYADNSAYVEPVNLDTQTAIIKSIPVMEFVAKKMGLIDEKLIPGEIRKNARYINLVLDLRNQVHTSIEGYTNIINIEVVNSRPQFAQQLANAVAEVYKEQNTIEANKQVIEAKKYIEEQLAVTKEKLETAQEKLRAFRESQRIISIETQTTEILRSLTDSEKEYALTKQEKVEIQELIEQLMKQESLPKEKVEGFYAEKVGPIFSNLNTKLVDLYDQRDLLLLDYNENHPEIQIINVKIDKVISNMINHLNDQIEKITKREQFLSDQIEKTKAQFNALPTIGFELEKIQNDLKINKNLYEDLRQKYQEVLIREAEKVEEVSIVRPALEPQTPINPPTTARTAAIGTVVGIILGLVIAFVFETMDTSIGTIEDVENFLSVPVLGIIPFIRPEEIEETLELKHDMHFEGPLPERYTRLISHYAPKSTLAESFRTLRTAVKFLCLEKGIKTILFTSSSAGEGKSTSATNLAITFAQIGSKTLIVEADLRKPAISRFLGIDREPGLTDVILGNYTWNEVVRTVTDIMMGDMSMEETMLTPGFDNLNIITCGNIPPNPSEIINSQRMTEFITQVKEHYDIVIFDTAPILPATDAVVLGTRVDGVVILYRVGEIARGALKRAKTQMDHVKANVLGVVLNGLKPEVSSDYKHYGYYKYYAYGEKDHHEKLPWYKKPIKKLQSLFTPGNEEKRNLFHSLPEKTKSLVGYFTTKVIPQAKEIYGKRPERLIWWTKVFLLVTSIIMLIGGLLWQFEMLRV